MIVLVGFLIKFFSSSSETSLEKSIGVSQDFKLAKTILVDDISIAGLLRSNGEQPCGKFSVKSQVEEIDELDIRSSPIKYFT